jgi:enterochelin esterase-like enzyme
MKPAAVALVVRVVVVVVEAVAVVVADMTATVRPGESLTGMMALAEAMRSPSVAEVAGATGAMMMAVLMPLRLSPALRSPPLTGLQQQLRVRQRHQLLRSQSSRR